MSTTFILWCSGFNKRRTCAHSYQNQLISWSNPNPNINFNLTSTLGQLPILPSPLMPDVDMKKTMSLVFWFKHILSFGRLCHAVVGWLVVGWSCSWIVAKRCVGASEAYSYYWTAVGNPIPEIQWYHFQPLAWHLGLIWDPVTNIDQQHNLTGYRRPT